MNEKPLAEPVAAGNLRPGDKVLTKAKVVREITECDIERIERAQRKRARKAQILTKRAA